MNNIRININHFASYSHEWIEFNKQGNIKNNVQLLQAAASYLLKINNIPACYIVFTVAGREEMRILP